VDSPPPPEDRGLGVADPPPHEVTAAVKRIVGKTVAGFTVNKTTLFSAY